jgi:hypothetical protein
MATCRVIIAEAMRALKALGQGDAPTIDELTTGLEAVQTLVLDLHDARGPMLDVDVPGGYAYPCGDPCDPCDPCPPPSGPLTWIPSENQRIRIQAGASVTITLPNAIPLFNMPDPYDYGFNAATVAPAVGTTGAADGIEYRQPRDGTRIEIVGTTQALYFYRADINSWMAATGLLIDTETPFNNRYNSALAALVAERLMETLPGTDEPTPGLAKRIARGRSALMLRTGTMRDRVVADYF